MKRVLSSPVTWLIVFIIIIFRDFFFFGKIPLPADALTGSYFPWLDYKWGYAVGVPVKNSLISDAFSLFFPWKYLAIDLLRQGIPPLWNKYALAGTPLLASYHTAAFFPGNLLLLFPKYFGWGMFIFASTLTSALGFCLFIKQHVTSKAAIFAGSVIFALSGLMTTWVEFGTSVWAMSFVPILFHCLDQFLVKNRTGYLTIFSLSLTSQILAGNVQVDIYSVLLVASYVIILRISQPKTVSYKKLIIAGLSALIGIGMASFQLLPTMEYFSSSIRSAENFVQNFNYGLINLNEMIRVWAADFLGNPVTQNYFGRLDYHEMSPFLGTLTLPLIFPLMLRRFRASPISAYFLSVFIFSVLMVISNPLTRFVFSQPLPLLTYSYASRLLFVTSFSAAALMSLGLEQLSKHQKYLVWVRNFSLILLFVTIGAIVISENKAHQLVSMRNSLLPVIFLSFLIVSSFFKIINRQVLIFMLVGIIAFDLGRYFNKHNPFVPPNIIFPDTPIITYLKSQNEPGRIAREMGPLFPPNSWVQYHLESIEGYDPLQLLDYSRFFRVIAKDKYNDEVGRFSQIINKASAPYLDALNVRYFLAVSPKTDEKASALTSQLISQGFLKAFEDGSVVIYQNPNALKRAYFIHKLIFVADKSEMGRILDGPEFDPTSQAIIIGEPFDISNTKTEVLSMSHGDNEVGIGVKADGESFLVLADTYDSGWKSYINGQISKVYQVNGALRGVRVPAGDSRVVFKYEPDSFKNGILISFSSLMLLLIVQIGLHLTKRK